MNRRIFFRNISLLVAGFLTGCNKKMMAAAGLPAYATITGTVTSQGNALANVIVSDGVQVVATNQQGQYKITNAIEGAFVFVSVPAGYAFPHNKGIPAIYKKVSATGHQTMNFELEPLGKDDTKHRFIIWADPQVKNDKDLAKMMAQSVPDTKQFIDSMGSDELLHGISVGDLVWDSHHLFPAYKDAMSILGIPFFQVLGNHDQDYNKGGDETSDKTFSEHFGPTYYSFNRGKVHYVVMDNVRYLGKDREYDGYITDRQLTWLKKDLSYVPHDTLLVISLHIPVHNGTKNRDELYTLLQPYTCHIMSGHKHYTENVLLNNIYEHNHAAVCGAWWTGPVCSDGTPPGYAVYEVDGTGLKWQYKSTGQNGDYQLSIQVRENDNNEKEIFANVWNWDPEWRVEWWADNEYKGILQQQPDFDPLAVSLYNGDQLPAGRVFVEPKKTDHIFKSTLPGGTKEIKVAATDRFGKVYQAVAVV